MEKKRERKMKRKMKGGEEGKNVGIFVEPANLDCPIGKADLPLSPCLPCLYICALQRILCSALLMACSLCFVFSVLYSRFSTLDILVLVALDELMRSVGQSEARIPWALGCYITVTIRYYTVCLLGSRALYHVS